MPAAYNPNAERARRRPVRPEIRAQVEDVRSGVPYVATTLIVLGLLAGFFRMTVVLDLLIILGIMLFLGSLILLRLGQGKELRRLFSGLAVFTSSRVTPGKA